MTVCRNENGSIVPCGDKPKPDNGAPKPPVPPSGSSVTNTPGAILPKTDAKYKAAAAALFPWLSSADRQTQTSLYGVSNKKAKPVANPSEMSGDLRNSYLSQKRASAGLRAISSIGGTGPGAQFLRQTLSLLKQYGSTTGEGMSRENYNQFATQLQSLMEGVKGQSGMTPWTALAQQFINPTLQAGSLMPTQKVGGQTVYGTPSKKLFT